MSHTHMTYGSQMCIDWFEYFSKNWRGRRQPIREASELVVWVLPFEHKIFPMFWVHWYGIICIFEIYPGCVSLRAV